MSEIEVSLENIGGFLGERALTLRKGLNVVEAPNAEGKTSVVEGLLALVLPDDILKQKRHFVHYLEGSGRVTLRFDGKKFERRLTAQSPTALYGTGAPIHPEGQKAAFFAFALPDNELLRMIETGQSLQDKFTEFSDAKYYTLAADWFKLKRQETRSTLFRYKDVEENLQRMEAGIRQFEKEIVDVEHEKAKLPKVDVSEIAPTLEIQREMERTIKEVTEKQGQIRKAQMTIQESQDAIKQALREKGYWSERIRNFYEKHPRYEEEIENLAKEKRNLEQKSAAFSATIDKIEFSLGEIGKQIEKALKFDVEECFVCGKKLTIQETEKRRENLTEEKLAYDKERRLTDSRITELDNELEHLDEERLRVKSEYEAKLRDAETNERRLNLAVKNNERLVEVNRSTIPELEKKLEKLRQGLNQELIDAYMRGLELEEAIKMRKTRVSELAAEAKKLENVRKIIAQNKTMELFLSATESHFLRRANEIRDAARKSFNRRIMEVYERLEYKDFVNVEINERYIIDVTRKDKGREFRQPVHSLSTSERLTIGVVTMLAGKEEYLRDFPFFILDEVITSYDPLRFEKIIEYIQQHVNYLVVTRLKPFGELEVKHQLPTPLAR